MDTVPILPLSKEKFLLQISFAVFLSSIAGCVNGSELQNLIHRLPADMMQSVMHVPPKYDLESEFSN
jgi:hypothetical protein